MDRKEAVTILQEKRDLARMLEAAEKSADWAAKDRVDSSSLRASQHGRYADALDMAISALSPPNEPLTIEQLREMDGEPVWIANVEGVSAQKAAAPGRADREREVERCRRRKNCWRSSSGCWWRWAGGTAPTWRRQLRRGGPGPRRE